ncbi:protein adenylyltransferase SelO [Azospirillum sp. SYSU D00513]|uniref:protein adenylyltransferase SelO n=1 Tax=Azospirillum sp. SYSU D00513 TaxID=2812561 RepID=UPI001A9583EE|nr:YdiU family protein [Azospirillum sp. SYSU D00513]
MPVSPRYTPDPRHPELGDGFFDPVRPADFPAHILRLRNRRWAERLGLDTLTAEEWIAHFARFEPLPGNLPQPLALRYHGHQFMQYNPDLGDGRGFLFAQLRDPEDGRLLDFGTKGSGRTPWSRGGDGRLTLKGGVREVLATSMLEALGVYTSKSFSLVETGEALHRGDEPSPTRSSVLVRLSHSHIRIGSFQRHAFNEDAERLQRLTDYTILTYMPQAWNDDPAARAAALLREACVNVARMGASWYAAGFVHGVLNTDNITVTGESFDYGPYRFLPVFDPRFTAAYFDRNGLYAFGRQPTVLHWNLERLAECLSFLCEEAPLVAAMDAFAPAFETAMRSEVLRRLGLASNGHEADGELIREVYRFLGASRAGYERFFFDWRGGLAGEWRAESSPEAAKYAGPDFAPLRAVLEGYAPSEDANLGHPYFAGEPCTLLIDEIERIWAPIAEKDDWSLFEAKLDTIRVMGEAYGTLPAT